jgi:WW domain
MSSWQAVFDATAKEYYYWNKETQQTQWEKPEGFDGEGAKEPVVPSGSVTKDADAATTDPADIKTGKDYYASKEYYEWYQNYMKEQQIQQSVAETSAIYAQSQKKDRFADLNQGLPVFDSASAMASKEYKQMSYFFDVEKYQEERALDRMKPKVVKKYTKKQVDNFKKQKHEKKVKRLLERMGKDA